MLFCYCLLGFLLQVCLHIWPPWPFCLIPIDPIASHPQNSPSKIIYSHHSTPGQSHSTPLFAKFQQNPPLSLMERCVIFHALNIVSLLPAPSHVGLRALQGPLITEGTEVTQSPCSDSLSYYSSLWGHWSLHLTLSSAPETRGHYTKLLRQSEARLMPCGQLCLGGLGIQWREQLVHPYSWFPHWTPKGSWGQSKKNLVFVHPPTQMICHTPLISWAQSSHLAYSKKNFFWKYPRPFWANIWFMPLCQRGVGIKQGYKICLGGITHLNITQEGPCLLLWPSGHAHFFHICLY